MENNVRFRNHISIIIERLGAFNGMLLFFLISNFELVEDVMKEGRFKDLKMILLVGGGVCLLYLVLAIYQLVIWSKTYIILSDQSIVVERNTINKMKNTIGIKNISNVNIERNLFELIIGTCKVKLDTNSLSTAESTDVSIVLKNKDGEQLQKHILQLMKIADGTAEEFEEMDQEFEEEWDYKASLKEILTHGCYSISFWVIMTAVLGAIAVGGVLISFFRGEDHIGIGALQAGLLMSGGLFFSALSNIVKGFVSYYDFRIARKANKLYIQYGFFKKMNYTIPIEKINGLVIEQSMLARFFHRYKGTMINIGMGDDSSESESFLFPYCTEEKMKQRIETLLPELTHVVEMEYEKQPKETWYAWSVPFTIFLGVIITGGVIANLYFPSYRMWIIFGLVVVVAFIILSMILGYITDGIRIGDQHILLVSGFFQKKYCFISCKKIQYLSFKKNPIARIFGLQNGQAFLLAPFLQRTQQIPYIYEEKVELLRKKILNKA